MGKEIILVSKEKKEFFVRDMSKDFHTKYGFVKASDLKKKEGSEIKTNIGKGFYIISPSFVDKFKRISRLPQIPLLKDIGAIIALTGVGKNSVVVDAGGGSGGIACFLAHIVKKVVSYEINDHYIKLIKKNRRFLGIKNLSIKKKNIYKKIDEKNVDLIILDLPEPWRAIKSAKRALKIGGFIASYSPTIPQVQQFVEMIEKDDKLINLMTIELMERRWKIEGRIARPQSGALHSGFLSFARRISK